LIFFSFHDIFSIMPRQSRLDAPGILHHVIIRGIERREIFQDRKDQDNLVGRLTELLPRTKTACYAWALLPNHAHFLFRTGTMPLSTLMGRLLTGYAVYFNRRQKRHGPLFQNRYKSIICQEDAYLKELVRYIHLNPLRAGTVSSLSALGAFKYAGHSAILGNQETSWQDVKYVLSYFGSTLKEARLSYLEYVENGVVQGKRPELTGGGLIRSLGGWEAVKKKRTTSGERIKSDQRILGDSRFVMEILHEAEDRYNRLYELKSRGYDLKLVERKVCEIFQIEPEEIYAKSREKIRADARGLYCYWAVRDLGLGQTELALRLGMSQPGVGYAVKRGERLVREKNYRLDD
jgi:REP element-mobilizing transposase RayT